MTRRSRRRTNAVLGIVAAGFIAFGVHCLLQARYRHINGDDEA